MKIQITAALLVGLALAQHSGLSPYSRHEPLAQTQGYIELPLAAGYMIEVAIGNKWVRNHTES